MEPSNDKGIAASRLFDKYAEEYQERNMDLSPYQGPLTTFCKLIRKENSKVLDIACGPGNVSRFLLNKKPGLIVFGIDLAPNMVALAQKNIPTGTFKIMDCRSISSLTAKFDAVVCGFCLPYLSKEEAQKLINDVSEMITDQGAFYLSTMEDDYSKSGYDRGKYGDKIHLYYHEGDYLINMLISCNFKIEEVSRVNSIMSNGKAVIDLVIVARKD